MTRRMTRTVRTAMLLAGAGLLAGCVYDPYTGSYYPCCATPYPYYPYDYRYYAPYYGGYPSGYPPPQYDPPPGYAARPYAAAPQALPGAPATLARRFAQANVTHDGRLTLQQARAAHWQPVARNFPDIDVARKGYVTLSEIRVWLETHHPGPNGTTG